MPHKEYNLLTRFKPISKQSIKSLAARRISWKGSRKPKWVDGVSAARELQGRMLPFHGSYQTEQPLHWITGEPVAEHDERLLHFTICAAKVLLCQSNYPLWCSSSLLLCLWHLQQCTPRTMEDEYSISVSELLRLQKY